MIDAQVYHPQLGELVEVARACPDTPIVVDHIGCVLGTFPFKDRRDEIIGVWKHGMRARAACPNMYLKVGSIGMPMMGFRWDRQERPPTSEELAAPWAGPLRWVIEEFGPQRCVFESDFPVDKRGVGYVGLWNAFKRIAADCSAEEKRGLFHDTAARAYRLPTLARAGPREPRRRPRAVRRRSGGRCPSGELGSELADGDGWRIASGLVGGS